jgi:undecaprenyl diphosphate synthase
MLTRTEDLRTLVALNGPTCIVFTPDKNRTWAESFGLSPIEGHTRGSKNARTIIRRCFNLGIRDVVFWAMSESNIHRRSPTERDHLISLLKDELRRQDKRKERRGFYFCGKWKTRSNDPELEELVAKAHKRTAKYQTQRLTVLFGYRGITDFKQAASKVCEKFGADAVENEDLIRTHMWVGHLPHPIDMMVRTGVEPSNKHNSDSLLPLHGEHAFIHDVPQKWPEFTVRHLEASIRAYIDCQRAKGA